MKRFLCVVLSALLIMSLAACGGEKDKGGENDFRIITSFYPVYVTTMNIVEGAMDVSVTNMTEPDIGCLHDYIPDGADLEKAHGADLFIASGKDMEAFVGNVSLGIPGLELLECGEDVSVVLEKDGKENPHYWMNINNVIEQTDKIKRTLCRLDPKNAIIYEKNAAEYTERLIALEEVAAERCKKLEGKLFVVYHDSFDYFADEFGLYMITMTEDNISEHKKEVANFGKLFTQQSLFESREFKKLQKELGVEAYALDTMTSGESDGDVRNAYINAIIGNLNILEEVLLS